MGIAGIVAAALKKVPWTSLAMNYGPELLKRFKGGAPPEGEEEAAEMLAEIEKRMHELETLVTQQDGVMREQQERIDLLTATCRELEGRVRAYRIVGVISALVAVGALVALAVR